MKKLALSLSLLLSCAMPAMADSLNVGIDTSPYKPMSWQEADGSWQGFEIELLQAICDVAKLSCVPQGIAWNGIIPALETGKIDMIMSSMTITPKRQEVVDFSSPYYASRAVYLGHKDVAFDPDDPASVKNLIIGVQAATSHADYLHRKFDGQTELKEYQSQDEQLADLVSGRVDVVLSGRMGTLSFLNSPEGQDMRALAVVEDESYPPLTVGAAFRKGDENIEKFNSGLETILKNGVYDELAEKYFDFDIYGMDRK